ncbi:lipase member H-like [Bacillus rossius redtenbacheri]|uniref:lipase member H-like n=1 Tax=Bacillus rossius redtenbacheri TaxID=93214 RepID=UPI002FDD569E
MTIKLITTKMSPIVAVLLLGAALSAGTQASPAALNEARAAENVRFLLFTKQNPSSATVVTTGVASSLGHFNANHETKFIIHGFLSDENSMNDVKNGFLRAGKDFNLIVVDWSVSANSLTAQASTPAVGTAVAEFIKFLVTKGLRTSATELVGFSLGAHVAGIAANRYKGGRIARITGLDPVGRRFENVALENRLDSSDAEFVQIIHTNGNFIGWPTALGHVDFFPNDGNKQYGCGIDATGVCSHMRAVAFYAESTHTATGFYGTKCTSWTNYVDGHCKGGQSEIMGAYTPSSARGSYYLWTKNSSPYALGKQN